MRIISSDVTLAASHAATQQQKIQQSLRAWVGKQRPDFEGQERAAASALASPSSTVQISVEGKAAQAAQAQNAAAAQAVKDAGSDSNGDPVLALIKQLVEYMLGGPIKVFDPADLQTSAADDAQVQQAAQAAEQAQQATQSGQPPQAGWGLEYNSQTTISETEQVSFQASGVIQTADNQQIQFNFSFSLQSSFQETSSVSVTAGDAHKVDPLVLNFAGNAAQLSSQKFAFDLNNDGKTENISFPQGAGFLAIDKNGDGKIDNGSELFGPGTGNGFQELRALDSDGNGWIDQNDPAYQKLVIWTKDASGTDHLTSLKDAGVAALYLGSTATPFDIKNAGNVSQGQLRDSGLWLSDDGKAGSLQQIDLTV